MTNNDNNSTFNSAKLTSFLARTADKTLKSFQWINTTPSDPVAVLIYSLRQDVTSHGVFRIFNRIPVPNRDIEKRVAFSGIIYLLSSHQNGREGQGSRNGRCPSLHTYPCQTPSPTIRLARQESDITFLQHYSPLQRLQVPGSLIT
ncbi:hypothetical protein AVEN_54608-1 [Araneus ventricosus]|uniref:Uncharacterized protein n=1 Tax=Araneus ventricosus TaxID=182803 RepID=A0A4Y2BMY0_ARAVE|nr:hypothetical protein AVEN_54608-1 [Araneus ventricosus]